MVPFLPVAMLSLLFSGLCLLGLLLINNGDMMYYLEHKKEMPISLSDQSGSNDQASDGF